MQALLSKLPAFMLPFVTRSLRGGRGKRYLIFSLLLASLSGVMGLWLTLGSGEFEQSVRSEFGLEPHEWELERETMTVIVHDEWELRAAQNELTSILETGSWDGYGPVSQLHHEGLDLIHRAAQSDALTRDQLDLREQARAINEMPIVQYGPEVEDWERMTFPWYDEQQVAALETAIATKAIPSVQMYQSPLSLFDALRFTGFLAGLALAALGTVFAPLLIAVQQAQERHENTLMPLSGTALSPRELALGLASGPGSIIAIFMAPQLAVFLLCSLFAGEVAMALALLAALTTTTVCLSFGAQLLGQLAGKKRTPGIIGIALMSLMGVSWLSSIVLVANADSDVAGFSAIVPQVGIASLLAEIFVDLDAGFAWVFVGTFAWTIGAAVLAYLMLTALARRIEGRDGAPLSFSQAGFGALVCMALVLIAFPDLGSHEYAVRQYIGLAMLALPLSLLFMGRIPTSDGPPNMRTIDLRRLLLEFGGWAAIYFVGAGLLGTDADAFHPVALGWLAWCVLVVGLLCVRVVAAPTKIAGNLWAGFCVFTVFVSFVHAGIWGMDGGRGPEEVFLFADISPVLGLIQVALVVWVPISLIRHLRNSLGSVRGEQPKVEA